MGGHLFFSFRSRSNLVLRRGSGKGEGGGEGGVRMYAFMFPVYGNETWNDFRILKDLTV